VTAVFPAEYARRYAHAQITSVDRGRLLLLVLEGGQTYLARARAALDAGDLARFAHERRRAQDVIAELLQTLDHAAGGEIAANLARLYAFMLEHLTAANVEQSARHIDEVLRAYAPIVDAYRAVLARPPAGERS